MNELTRFLLFMLICGAQGWFVATAREQGKEGRYTLWPSLIIGSLTALAFGLGQVET